MQILVTAPFPAHLMDKLRTVSRELVVEQIKLDGGRWPADLKTTAEVIYALSDVPRPDQAPNLRWVQAHFAGIDHLVDKPLWHSDILVTSASGIHTTNIAQYVFAQILAWANRVPRWLQHQHKADWPANRWEKFVPQELRGSVLGIVGYGSIGREVARVAKTFGMKVLATKRDARRLDDHDFMLPATGDPKGALADRIYPPEATRSMVGECDFVVIAAPLTPKTHHLFDEEMLKGMKPSAFLVNIGRGAIIKEDDLVKGLKKGWLAGAGLDVFETEPLPAKSPLWGLENVILSPHVSGFTPHYDERVTDLFAENLRRYLAGEPLLNVVNRERGY
ncbi:MAG: D-2-hydroxyacid dehydrogenase [Chloroflexi bacterium]|nr:D-2-hydroxyacid dehydrogenase [Chloroflexota bacterium]